MRHDFLTPAGCLRNRLLMLLTAGPLVACQTVPPAPVDGLPQRPGPNVTSDHRSPAPAMAATMLPAASAPASGAKPAAGTANTARPAPAAEPPMDADGRTAALRDAPDLWGRLRRGFSLPALPHPLAEQHARRFAQERFLERRADRLRLYLPLIVEELERRKLPLELALLPLVESALNPQARSPVGALGTWQFMAPTARRFELRTSRLVDDRKNVMAATRAAADYLTRLHGQFQDWHLAMAAYNWGEGRVQRAVDRQRARGEPADFTALASQMPAETRNYVPQIDALRRLVADPAAWGATLPDLPDGHGLVEAALLQDTDLDLLRRWTGLPLAALLALNPAIKPPLALASATPQLLLPDDAAQRFTAAQIAHNGRTASWSVVRLAATRPVDGIARQYGASAQAVRQANGIPGGMKPVAGSVLLLPVAPDVGTRADPQLVAQADLDLVADLVRVEVRSRPLERPGDLARRSGVPLAQLLAWNRLPKARWHKPMKTGTALVLWLPRDQAEARQRQRAR